MNILNQISVATNGYFGEFEGELKINVRAHHTNPQGCALKTHAPLEKLKSALNGINVDATFLTGNFYNLAIIEDSSALLETVTSAHEAWFNGLIDFAEEATKADPDGKWDLDFYEGAQVKKKEVVKTNRFDIDW